MFKVGDRVVSTRAYDGLPKGSTGIVRGYESSRYPPDHAYQRLAVEFDDWARGHRCDRYEGGVITTFCPSGMGYWVPPSHLQHIATSPLEIAIRDYVNKELQSGTIY